MKKFGIDMMSLRLVKDKRVMADKQITTPVDAASIFGRYIASFDREVFLAIYCDPVGVPLCGSLLSIGVIQNTYASPREVMKMAYYTNANKILVMHNHPSGFCDPSPDDKKITEYMKKTCKILDFTFLDHIIIGNEKSETFYSFTSECEYHMPYEEIRFEPDLIKAYHTNLEKLNEVAEESHIYEGPVR